MNKSILAVVLAALLVCTSAWAVRVATLYEAELTVPSQTADVRADAVRDAFLKVLIKVTGNQDIEKNRRIRDSINRADYYVQEYSYSSPSVSSSTYTLHVQFNETDVKRLLRKAGVDYWGEMRPLILVWLATINDKKEIDILGVETPGNLLHVFKKQGERFGLPLIFPVMDVTDMNMISSENIVSVSLPVLKTAATRYAPGALLIGTIEQGKQGYDAHWNLILGDKIWDWSISAPTQQMVISDVLDDVSQTLSRRYVSNANTGPSVKVTLEVKNISKREDLAELVHYLKRLPTVRQVELAQVDGDSVSVSVLVRGDKNDLQENVSIGQKLLLRSQETGKNKIIYEWVR